MNTAQSKCAPRAASRGARQATQLGFEQPIDVSMGSATTCQPMTCRTTNFSCTATAASAGRRSCTSSDTCGAVTQPKSAYTSSSITGALTRNSRSSVGLDPTTSVWSTLPPTHHGSIRSSASSLGSSASCSAILTSPITKRSALLFVNTLGGETQTHLTPD